MVVFEEGEAKKADYRTFKVKTATNDDFASMYEVLSRRFRRAREKDAGWGAPDLLVIDGGKGQLATAMAALRDAQVNVSAEGMDVLALAKDPDRVFLPNAKDAIKLRANSAELFILARIRDEAHRFAVTFHKKLRRRRTLRSALEDVPGVGAKRKRELLKHFGSLKKIKAASLEELAAAPGMSQGAAESVVQYFRGPVVEVEQREDVAEDAASAELEEIEEPALEETDDEE
jgi:excinuclease ABC subunit C